MIFANVEKDEQARLASVPASETVKLRTLAPPFSTTALLLLYALRYSVLSTSSATTGSDGLAKQRHKSDVSEPNYPASFVLEIES